VIAPSPAYGPDARLLEVWAAGRDERPFRRTELLLAAAGLEPSDDPSVGVVDARLLDFREGTFGPRMAVVVDCPACGQHLEVGFEVADLRAEPSKTKPTEVVSDDGGLRVRFRSPTLADLRAIASAESLDAARRGLVERCVVDARRAGQRIDPASLPDDILSQVGEAMAEGDRQADIRLGLRCPDCAHAWAPPFDVASFLWIEIEAWVRRLIADVHTLARAYGWTEAEILGLPPARRQAYLELVLG
jgi:hypothetical protein